MIIEGKCRKVNLNNLYKFQTTCWKNNLTMEDKILK